MPICHAAKRGVTQKATDVDKNATFLINELPVGGLASKLQQSQHLQTRRLSMEKKNDKEKSNKGIWRSDALEASQGQTRDVPGTPGTFGPDLCVNQY